MTLSEPAQQSSASAAGGTEEAEEADDEAEHVEFLRGTRVVIYVGDSFDSTKRDKICDEIQRAGGRSVVKHRPATKYTHALCDHRGDSYFSSGPGRASWV